MSLTNPTKEETLALFTSIEQHFPTSTLGSDKWYILTLAALVGGGHPEIAADLYLHLISRPEFTAPESRKALVRRLREVLVKLVSVIGVPKAIDAVFSIAGVEREEDRDYSFSRYSKPIDSTLPYIVADSTGRENWQSGEENRKRGREWLDQIYKANHKATEDTLAAHRDFCKEIPSRIKAAIVSSEHCTNHNAHSLALHRNHLRPVPLRPQHPLRRRNRARRLERYHDPEPPARDRLAPARNTSDRRQPRRRRDDSAMREFLCSKWIF